MRLGLDAADSAETIEQRGGRASATVTSASRAINFAEVLNDGADGLVKLIVRVVSAGSAQGLDVIECRAKPVLFDLEVVAGLQVYPEPLRGAEVAGEP